MRSRGNDLSSAAAVLFVLKENMHVCDDECSISVQSVYEGGGGEMVAANKDWRGEWDIIKYTCQILHS
jgi:hypothetical protein